MQNFAHELSEQGLIPDTVVRRGIRHLLKKRLDSIGAESLSRASDAQRDLIKLMDGGPIAEVPEKANEQHYELPTAFFEAVLGSRMKYSCGFWDKPGATLDDAESRSLALTCEHADIQDGMAILELGCGWGSLTLWMAEHYPNSRITAVSNSIPQGNFIRSRAGAAGLRNIDVITADMNYFHPEKQFHRVVSLEMFEHMRNWQALMARINEWLLPSGQLMIHIFAHRCTPYLFEDKDKNDWMSRYFFTGGLMPSVDLPMQFQDELLLTDRWLWDGKHYEKTSNAWLVNMDAARSQLWPIFEQTYGKDFAKVWWMRWRMFFMACAELFGYKQGQEWLVGHYLFEKRGAQ